MPSDPALRPPCPQIVLCSGMVRSASTWSYNACRSILQFDPWPTVAGFFGEQTQIDQVIAATDRTANNLLIKAHLPSEATHQAIAQGHIKNIFTYRDPRDSLSSRIRFEACDVQEFQDFFRVLGIVRANLGLMDRYQADGRSLLIPFDRIMDEPAAEIARIAAYLEREITPDHSCQIAADIGVDRARQVVGELEHLTPSDTFQTANRTIERTTLLQTGHINGAKTGRWRDDLTPEQQLAAHLVLGRWLIDLGYETETTWLHQIDHSLDHTSLDWRGVARNLWQQEDYGSAFQVFARAIEQDASNRGDVFDYITLAALRGDREAAGLAWWSYIADRDLLELSSEIADLQTQLIHEASRQEAMGTATGRDRAAALRDCLADLDD
ncbi:MAG: hypothetical protein EAZ61_11175 [Oscillatoriales cyanobacterium]|nr:MAG: hypothetical protein EAZ61_11175 [Oscillatoriales cyanobacterium]